MDLFFPKQMRYRVNESLKETMTLKTEDTGKVFEMAICLAYGIKYDGKYKYSMEDAEKLKQRLSKLHTLFPICKHTAKRGSRYDFTAVEDQTSHLSAKTTKKGVGKVAPQVVGQCQPSLFCKIIGIEYKGVADLKRLIQEQPIRILDVLVEHTFDCPNIFYNKEKDTIRYITLNSRINWDRFKFIWTCNPEKWNNSSTLKLVIDGKEIPLVEFQFHTKSRTNMAIRWCYENFLSIFKENLTVINI
jgi:hypothetical protein